MSASANAGSQRIELPELLGEYHFDGGDSSRKFVHLDTLYGVLGVSRARVVLTGTLHPGKAHGDGVILAATDFELPGRTSATFVTPGGGFVGFGLPAEGPFVVDETFLGPFYNVIPLPCPCGGQPEFDPLISFEIRPSLLTQYPPALESAPVPRFETDGMIVDVPIVANVSEAYLLVSGVGVAPEPHSIWLAMAAAAALVIASSDFPRQRNVLHRRRYSRVKLGPKRT